MHDVARLWPFEVLQPPLEIHAQKFLDVFTMVARMSQVLFLRGTIVTAEEPLLPALLPLEDDLFWLRDTLTKMELTASAGNTERIIKLIRTRNERMVVLESRSLVSGLLNTIVDDLRGKLFMMVPCSKMDYFNGSKKEFPPTVRDNFLSANQDMDEAGRCFALGQNTACVFHLMRIMEVGLNAMGNALNLDVAKNWHTALNEIEKEIKFWNLNPSAGWKIIEPFYADAATHFRMVKDARRNYTMHIKAHYDERKAQDIFNNVSAFMRHLAERLHE